MFNKEKKSEKKAEKKFKKTTLYIVRIDREGNYRNSAPCVDCLNIIMQLNIKKIIFSTEDDFQIYKASEFNTTHQSNGNRFLESILNPHTRI